MTTDRIVTCSVTAAGAALAQRLPYEHVAGGVAATVAARWYEVDALVLVGATGIAVRAVAPHLSAKGEDPTVVCVDDAGRWVIALAGGHHGANDLAREVAALLGPPAEAVVTTATDLAGLPALDLVPGCSTHGDVAGVTRAWLDGSPPTVAVDTALSAWPLPDPLAATAPSAEAAAVVVTDRALDPAPGQVVLCPRSLVVGVGASRGADPDGLAALVTEALVTARLDARSVGVVATLEAKAREAAVVALGARLGVPVKVFPATLLAALPVPNPSDAVAEAVGTRSVSEAAALAAAGPGATLVVEKRKSADATVAVARRACPDGSLAVVGLGPGDPSLRTFAAAAAVRRADSVIGYGPYIDLAGDLLTAHQRVLRYPIGAERERCEEALCRAAAGEHVALVCSGDPGVYAMASLVLELAPAVGNPEVTVVPGVTAALAAGAALGAPLGHDHASVSLSDLLTPWDVIERRLRAAAAGDFAVSLYNPRSARRSTHLQSALAILAEHRAPGTPAAVVTDVGRPGEQLVRTTLAELDPATVGMLSIVVVGSSTTRWVGNRMVTPRGYTG